MTDWSEFTRPNKALARKKFFLKLCGNTHRSAIFLLPGQNLEDVKLGILLKVIGPKTDIYLCERDSKVWPAIDEYLAKDLPISFSEPTFHRGELATATGVSPL